MNTMIMRGNDCPIPISQMKMAMPERPDVANLAGRYCITACLTSAGRRMSL